MPFFIPFDFNSWQKGKDRFLKLSTEQLSKHLEEQHPGDNWSPASLKIVNSNDLLALQKLSFISSFVKELKSETGELWMSYLPEGSEWYEEIENPYFLEAKQLVAASAKMLSPDAHRILEEWLNMPDLGSQDDGLYILSPSQISEIAHEVQNNDYPVESINALEFEHNQEGEFDPWQTIIFEILGYVLHYGKYQHIGIAYSQTEFIFPERTEVSDAGLAIFKSYLAQQAQHGIQGSQGWLYNVQNMPGHLFIREDRTVMKIEPDDAIVFWRDLPRKWSRDHLTFVNSQGEQFHRKSSYPMLLERILGKQKRLYQPFKVLKGPCENKACKICQRASTLAQKMLLTLFVILHFSLLAKAQCDSSSEVSFVEYIDVVSCGAILNQSGDNGGYADFTAQTSRHFLSDSIRVEVTTGYDDFPYPVTQMIYLDLNQDGQLDEQELINDPSAGNCSEGCTFLLPANLEPGERLLRIILTSAQDWADVSACGIYEFGETEDYTLQLVEENDNCPIPQNLSYSSDGFYSLNVNCDAVDEVEAYYLYVFDQEGNQVLVSSSSDPTFTITDPRLENCANYQFGIRTACAEDQMSPLSELQELTMFCDSCSAQILVDNPEDNYYVFEMIPDVSGNIVTQYWLDEKLDTISTEATFAVFAGVTHTYCLHLETDEGCQFEDCVQFGENTGVSLCDPPVFTNVQSLNNTKITGNVSSLLTNTRYEVKDISGQIVTGGYTYINFFDIASFNLQSCEKYVLQAVALCSAESGIYSDPCHPLIVDMHCEGCACEIHMTESSFSEIGLSANIVNASDIESYEWYLNNELVCETADCIVQADEDANVCLWINLEDGSDCSACSTVENVCQIPKVGYVYQGFSSLDYFSIMYNDDAGNVEYALYDEMAVLVDTGQITTSFSTIFQDSIELCSAYTLLLYNYCSAGVFLPSEPYTFYSDCPEGECTQVSSISAESDQVYAVDLTWDLVPAAIGYNVQVLNLPDQELLVEQATMNTNLHLVSPHLLPCQSYEVNVQAICDAGFLSDATQPQQVSIPCPTIVDDCSGAALYAVSEHIASIEIGDFLLDSGNNGGYLKYTEETIKVQSAQASRFVLNPGFDGDTNEVVFQIFIDYNQDQFFTEEELLFQSQPQSSTIDTLLQIPEEIAAQVSGLRVQMIRADQLEDYQTCESAALGEIEDFLLEISGPCDAQMQWQPTSTGYDLAPTPQSLNGNVNEYLINNSNRLGGGFDETVELEADEENYQIICMTTFGPDCSDETCLLYPPDNCDVPFLVSGSSPAPYTVDIDCWDMNGVTNYIFEFETLDANYNVKVESPTNGLIYFDEHLGACQELRYRIWTQCNEATSSIPTEWYSLNMNCVNCEAGFSLENTGDGTINAMSNSSADADIITLNWILDGDSISVQPSIDITPTYQQELCLSIETADACLSTYCESIGPSDSDCLALEIIALTSEAPDQIKIDWQGLAQDSLLVSVYNSNEQLILQEQHSVQEQPILLESSMLQACTNYAITITQFCTDELSSLASAAELVDLYCSDCALPDTIQPINPPGPYTADFTWQQPDPGPDTYEYYLILQEDTMQSGTLNENNLSLQDLLPCEDYTLTLQSNCLTGSANLSLPFSTDCPISLQAINEASLKVYPNPNRGEVQLSTKPSPESRLLMVYNAQGQVIAVHLLPAEIGQMSILLPPGLYLLQLNQSSSHSPVRRVLVLD